MPGSPHITSATYFKMFNMSTMVTMQSSPIIPQTPAVSPGFTTENDVSPPRLSQKTLKQPLYLDTHLTMMQSIKYPHKLFQTFENFNWQLAFQTKEFHHQLFGCNGLPMVMSFPKWLTGSEQLQTKIFNNLSLDESCSFAQLKFQEKIQTLSRLN